MIKLIHYNEFQYLFDLPEDFNVQIEYDKYRAQCGFIKSMSETYHINEVAWRLECHRFDIDISQMPMSWFDLFLMHLRRDLSYGEVNYRDEFVC